MIEVLTWVMVALAGLAVGSFLNVVVWRLPRGENLARPRSRCPGCHAMIQWYDNVPVLSWLLLRARCRGCGTAISTRYPLVEVATGVLFVLAWWVWGWHPPTAIFVMLALSALLAVTFIDWEHKIIPDSITKPGMALAILASPFVMLHPEDWLPDVQALPNRVLHSVAGALVGAGIILLIRWLGALVFRKEAMGLGDVKLMGLIGAMVGPLGALYTLLLGSLGGALIGVLRLLWARGRPLRFPLHVRSQAGLDAAFDGARIVDDTLVIPAHGPPTYEGNVRVQMTLPAAGILEDEDAEIEVKGRLEASTDAPGTWTIRVTKASDQDRERLDLYAMSLRYVPFGPFLALGGALTLLFGAEVRWFVTEGWPSFVRGLF